MRISTFLLLSCCSLVLTARHNAAGDVRINELMPVNETTIADEDGEYADWIELHNSGTASVSLAGWALTDDKGDRAQWIFPATNIPPGGYMLIFASDKNRRTPGEPLHLNFKLSAEGEYLALIKQDGHTFASEFDRYPMQFPDISYGYGATTGIVGYFAVPTPGAPNGVCTPDAGPRIRLTGHRPLVPADNDPLTVTTRIEATQHFVSNVVLHYRVMYGSETAVPMLDNGSQDDGVAGNGIFGAVIPAAASSPGQMVRYYITSLDTAGNLSRWPMAEDTAEYLGTVVHDPTIITNIPVYHWFVQNPSAADTWDGTRCSLFYDGEFFDNVYVRIKGHSSSTQTKKPHEIAFNKNHPFPFMPGQERVDEVNFNSLYNDQSYMREILAWETLRDAGAEYAHCYHVQMRQNGQFHSLVLAVEQFDGAWLRRMGLDDAGRLFKNADNQLWLRALTNEYGQTYQLKRPDDGNVQPLADLVKHLMNNNAALKQQYAFDHINAPQVINYLAAHMIIQDMDFAHKNHYLYYDTYNTREWRVFAWDKDLTFGHSWGGSTIIVTQDGTDGTGLSGPYNGHFNTLYGIVYNMYGWDIPYMNFPDFRQMYARRIRSVIDQLLQPPDTPVGQLKYEARIEQLRQMIKPLAEMDRAKWGFPPPGGYFNYPHLTIDQACTELTNAYFAARRKHLYVTHNVSKPGGIIPDSQPGNGTLVFVDSDPVPASGNQGEEYISFRNASPFTFDISGWRLTNAIIHTFAPGTVLPTNYMIYVTKNAIAFRDRAEGPTGGEHLLVQGNYKGRLSAWGGQVDLYDAQNNYRGSHYFSPRISPMMRFLHVSEIMYHPPKPPAGSPYQDEDFEFIELCNIYTSPLNITGAYFSAGITFAFGPDTKPIPPNGACIVLVKNLDAFASRYDTNHMVIAGTFSGKLSNSGDLIETMDPRNEPIQSFRYDASWYPETDGGGFSLESSDVRGPLTNWAIKAGWQASELYGGTPGHVTPEPALLAALALVLGLGWIRRA